MKLDIFNHIFPKTFYDKMLNESSHLKDMGKNQHQALALQVQPPDRVKPSGQWDQVPDGLPFALRVE